MLAFTDIGTGRSILPTVLLLGLVGCGSNGAPVSPEPVAPDATFSVEAKLASDFDSSAPTTVGIVNWSVDVAEIQEAFIEFGLDETYGMRAPVNLEEPGFRTLLLGMKPEREYHFRISARDASTTYASDDYVIQTGARFTLSPITRFDVLDEAHHERGFLLTSVWRGENNEAPVIVDADGDIVWWHVGVVDGIARAAMSADGKNLWMVSGYDSGRPLQRVTMDGLDAQTYEGTRGSHDMTAVLGETMVYLDYGESDCDSLFEIDPSGTTTEVFESEGIVDPDVGQAGCHGNAVHYYPDEDAYTFSDRDQDILLVSRADGSVLWRLSEVVEGGNAAWGTQQHGHQLFPDTILFFANRADGLRHSAIFEYTRDGEELMHYVGPSYSTTMGDVQRLPGGNMLVVYSNESYITEVDPSGNIVLEIAGNVGSTFGYSHFSETLYAAP